MHTVFQFEFYGANRYVLFLRLDVRFKLEQSHVTTVLAIAVFHIAQVSLSRDFSKPSIPLLS